MGVLTPLRKMFENEASVRFTDKDVVIKEGNEK